MNSHTPGPWHLTGFCTTGRSAVIYSTKTTEQVLPFYCCDRKSEGYARHMADKLLIEATPELLEALANLRNEAKEAYLTLNRSGSDSVTLLDAIRQAEAAIEKATKPQFQLTSRQ